MDELNYSPPGHGKGMIMPDGSIRTWNCEPDGHHPHSTMLATPHHGDMLNEDESPYDIRTFYISPDRGLEGLSPELLEEVSRRTGLPVDSSESDFKFGSAPPISVEILDTSDANDANENGDHGTDDRPGIAIFGPTETKVLLGDENGFHQDLMNVAGEFVHYGPMGNYISDLGPVALFRVYDDNGVINNWSGGGQPLTSELRSAVRSALGSQEDFKFGAAEQPEINVIDLIRESDNGSEHDDEGGGVSHPVYIYRGMRMRWDQSSEGLLAPIINMYIGAEGAYHSDIPYKWLAPIIKDLTFVAQCRYDGELWGSGLENLSESEKAACEAKLDEFFGTPKDFKFGADNKPFGTGWESLDPRGGEGIVDHFLGNPDFNFESPENKEIPANQLAESIPEKPLYDKGNPASQFGKDDSPIFANILRNWVNSFENEGPSGITNSDLASGGQKSTSRIQKVLDKFRRKSEQVRVQLDEEDLKFGPCEECGFNHKPGPCPKSMGGPMIIPEEPTDISELKNLSEEDQGDDEGAKKKSRRSMSAAELTPVWVNDDGRVVGTGRANKGIIIPREGDELGGYSLIVLPEQGQIWIGVDSNVHHATINIALEEAGLKDAPKFSFWTRFDRLMPDWIDPNNQEAAAFAPAICEALGLPDYPLASLEDLRNSESATEDFHFGAAELNTPKTVYIKFQPSDVHKSPELDAPWFYLPEDNAVYFGPPGGYHYEMLSQDSEFRNKFLNGDGASAITFWMKALQEGTFLSGRVTWPPNSAASGAPRQDQKITFYGSPTPDQVEMINRALGQPEPEPQGGEEFHFSKSAATTPQEASAIMAKMKFDFDPGEFAVGMDEEYEHQDVTGGDPYETAKIVAAHLKEDPDYYAKLNLVGLSKDPKPFDWQESGL